MAEVSKPDLSLIWSSAGDVLKPSDTKIQQGWQVEIPPRQWFNWYQNKTDTAISHINQHGIAVWDNKTEYQAGVSYSQGSDGVIYKAVQTNTGVNPSGDTTGAWKEAFYSVDAMEDMQLLATNGFKKYPDGYMECWGQFTTNAQTQSVDITFAQPFIETPFAITGSHYGAGGAMFVAKGGGTPTGFVAILSTLTNGTATGALTGAYVAKGRWK